MSKRQLVLHKNNEMLRRRQGGAVVCHEGEFLRGAHHKVMPVRALDLEEWQNLEDERLSEAMAVSEMLRKEREQKKEATYARWRQDDIKQMLQQIKNKAIPLDEIQLELVQKYQSVQRGSKQQERRRKEERKKKQLLAEHGVDGYRKLVYKGEYIKRRALVDQQLIINKKADFSYAQRKWNWIGEDGGGMFESPDLQEWFNVWNQT